MSVAVARGPASRWGVPAAAAVAVAGAVALRVSAADLPSSLQFGVVVATSIIVEAFPFVMMGAAVSAAIESFVPEHAIARVARLPLRAQVPAAALSGFAFPVCECGSVPVARRLVARGLHPSAGIAFMLAAPVFNPIVLLSTAVAYGSRGVALEMVVARAGLGLLVALVAAWAIGPTLDTARTDGAIESERGSFAHHFVGDFLFMARYVVIGAAIAAALQVIVPQSALAAVASSPAAAVGALMLTAFVLSLCSEADAFVAASFATFPLGAHAAFLVLGPVLDVKLTVLYGATFGRAFVARLALVAIPLVLAGSLWLEALVL